jgi:phytanoyl-CoA hydroxylase
VPHQDSTFLHTEPNSTLGFWVPVERCTTSNGCLWAIPGSHHGGLANQRRMVRTADGGVTFTAPQAEFVDKDFVALEINAGTLVLIHGNLVHKSDENRSTISRHAYTWHCIDGSHSYDALNWLQPSKALPFPDL